MGGAALDATGVPLPDDTLSAAKQSHAVLLGAIGGYLPYQFCIFFVCFIYLFYMVFKKKSCLIFLKV